MFSFWKKKVDFGVSAGPIEVVARHCVYSSVSQHKRRFEGFSREACFANFLETARGGGVRVRYFLDGAKAGHFLEGMEGVEERRSGSEARAFLDLLEYLEGMRWEKGTIVYIVEDDYLHRPGWVEVLREGFEVEGADYVTLYDHRDKYFFKEYEGLKSRLFATRSCHWRSVPSTTNTFAVRYGTLMEDLKVHRKFSLGRKISADHEKFCALGKGGRMLISAIPGWSTHAEPDYASPCFDWNQLLESDQKGGL
jgi:hypothetical protein